VDDRTDGTVWTMGTVTTVGEARAAAVPASGAIAMVLSPHATSIGINQKSLPRRLIARSAYPRLSRLQKGMRLSGKHPKLLAPV